MALAALAPSLLAALGSGAPLGSEFFVLPTGSDSAGGTSAATPFASVERAMLAARQVADGGATITLLAGTYRLQVPIRITAADSGPARPLILRAANDHAAVLSGGRG